MAFIVLDGPDATGTSTHCALLAERLRSHGIDVVETAEPTQGPVGKNIRRVLDGLETKDALALQLLFTDDRAWHVREVIRPALQAGKTVVCDRYWYSTVAYAKAQGLDVGELRKRNGEFPQPDIVFFTLPPVDVALRRMGKREHQDLFEKEAVQRKIHDEYRLLTQEFPAIHTIDTSSAKEETADSIWEIVTKQR